MLSRLVINFLPRSKRPLVSWLQSPSAVIWEPQKIKSDTVSPSISHEVMGPDAMIFQPRQQIKKQGHYFANKGLSSQSCGFSTVVMYECDSWTVKKAERQRIYDFEL